MEFEKLIEIIFRPTGPYRRNSVGFGETKIFLRLALSRIPAIKMLISWPVCSLKW